MRKDETFPKSCPPLDKDEYYSSLNSGYPLFVKYEMSKRICHVFAVTEPPCFYLDGGETQKGEWKNNGLYERFPPRFSYVKPSPL